MPKSRPTSSTGADLAVLARRIVAAAPGRDRAAESELYANLAPRVRLYGLRHLRDTAAAEDLAQDVLLMTIRRLSGREIRDPAQVTSFVLGTARQMVIDQRRGQARRLRILDTFSAELQVSEVLEPFTDSHEVAQLRRCLEQLAERERTVMLLSFYDDRCAADVANELGLSAANVRVIRHRSIERLRNCLAGAESGGERG